MNHSKDLCTRLPNEAISDVLLRCYSRRSTENGNFPCKVILKSLISRCNEKYSGEYTKMQSLNFFCQRHRIG